jgi:hypothetical protein
MFRTFFRSLIVSRTQPKARPQVQRFRPQLEMLENRLAPSGFGFNLAEVEHVRDVGVATAQAGVAFNGGTTVQVVHVGFGIGI